jgi:phosphohistidine phosphatase
MSLSLYVLRHGKAEFDAPHGGDHARPLRKRGRAAAKDVGTLLERLDEAPVRVLSSNAVRALETVELAREAGGWKAEIEAARELYGATPEKILARLRGVEGSPARLLLVGHEPGLSGLVGLLTGGSPPVFPTAALARIDFDTSAWSELGPGSGALAWLVVPRLFEAWRASL